MYVERETDGDGEDDETIDEDSLAAPDLLTFKDGVIDLGPELRDEILLELPVSVFCREDCLGLCPVCGGNRNLAPCDCALRQQQAQSKFAALAKLKT
jgi:uncharacterized protein